MNLKELKDVLQVLEDQAITEFELEQDGTKLRVRRQGATSGRTAAAPAPASAPPVEPPPPAAAPEAQAPVDTGLAIVKSPIVGTFFRAPDPNSPPFVSVGDEVKVGQVLCIIEAMKLMNEIEADAAGEIVKIHHENGQPVQYGEPLFTVRSAS